MEKLKRDNAKDLERARAEKADWEKAHALGQHQTAAGEASSFLEENPALYEFLINQAPRSKSRGERPLSTLIDGIGRQVAIVIGDQLRAAGLDAGGAEPMAFGIVGMVHHAGDWWIRSQTMSRDALTDYLSTLLWSGFSGLREATAAAGAAGVSD